MNIEGSLGSGGCGVGGERGDVYGEEVMRYGLVLREELWEVGMARRRR